MSRVFTTNAMRMDETDYEFTYFEEQFKGGFPLDEFVRANRIFSSLKHAQFYISDV